MVDRRISQRTFRPCQARGHRERRVRRREWKRSRAGGRNPPRFRTPSGRFAVHAFDFPIKGSYATLSGLTISVGDDPPRVASLRLGEPWAGLRNRFAVPEWVARSVSATRGATG